MTFFISKLAGCRRRPQRVESASRSDDAEAEEEGKSKPMDETNAGPIYSSDFLKTSPREFSQLRTTWATAAEQALAEISYREDIDGRSGAFRGVSLRGLSRHA
jgi:hypothetical protein